MASRGAKKGARSRSRQQEDQYAFVFLPSAPAACACFLGSQEYLQHTFFSSAFHSMYSFGERIFFADQAVNVDCAFLQEIERRLKSAAARTQYRDLINDEPRLVDLIDLARSLKC